MITIMTFPIITFTMLTILDNSKGQTKIYYNVYQLTSQKLTIMLERKYFYEANFGVKSIEIAKISSCKSSRWTNL